MDVMFWRVKFLMRACSSVLLPTLGGPTMATTIGGGSTGVRSTSGMCCFFVSRSCARWKRFWALSTDWTAKAFGLRCLASCSWTCGFLAFFFSALRPFHPKFFFLNLFNVPSTHQDSRLTGFTLAMRFLLVFDGVRHGRVLVNGEPGKIKSGKGGQRKTPNNGPPQSK